MGNFMYDVLVRAFGTIIAMLLILGIIAILIYFGFGWIQNNVHISLMDFIR